MGIVQRVKLAEKEMNKKMSWKGRRIEMHIERRIEEPR
jgi:hypothetical protein